MKWLLIPLLLLATMRVDLFGVGTKSESPAITAQRRINCFVERRQEREKTTFALVGTPGLTAFCTTIGASPSRGMWPVNTLATPLVFTVHAGTLYSINNAGVTAVIGAIGTTTGDVSMVDNGTFLVLVDGAAGYSYNMVTPAGLNLITDGNFTTSPKAVTWQDTYFIVSSGATNQFQLSAQGDPTTWPAVNIAFTQSSPGALQNIIADHSTLIPFSDVNTEFWQDQGTIGLPYAPIPGSAQEFGLAAPFSLAKYDNSLAGLFHNRMGGPNVSRMSGFRLQKISDEDIDYLLQSYATVSDAEGYAYQYGTHPMYQINFPTPLKTLLYDGFSKVWSELQDTNGSRHWGQKFANFQNKLLVSDYRNGNIYRLDGTNYTDNGANVGMEVWSKHIWQDDKYIGIQQVQIDMQQGVGTATGQGANPQIELDVSRDGGNSFYSVGFASVGPAGDYTQRVMWTSLGTARDWVLKLRITDPVFRVITGARAELVMGTF
jgi:hypothetical protein